MNKTILSVSAFLFMVFIPLKACFAQTEIVILGADYKPPKIYQDAGAPKGILVDIIRYVDKRLEDYTITIKLYPFARAYRYALQGKGGIVGLSTTDERLKLFDYSELLYNDEIVIVTKRGHEFPFENVEDLQGKVIGMNRGGSYGEKFEQYKDSGLLTVENNNSPALSLKKVLAERLDGSFMNPGAASLEYTISQNPSLLKYRNELVILPVPFAVDPNFLGFAKSMKMQEFLRKWNRIVQQGDENGDIQEIIDQYNKL